MIMWPTCLWLYWRVRRCKFSLYYYYYCYYYYYSKRTLTSFHVVKTVRVHDFRGQLFPRAPPRGRRLEKNVTRTKRRLRICCAWSCINDWFIPINLVAFQLNIIPAKWARPSPHLASASFLSSRNCRSQRTAVVERVYTSSGERETVRIKVS